MGNYIILEKNLDGYSEGDEVDLDMATAKAYLEEDKIAKKDEYEQKKKEKRLKEDQKKQEEAEEKVNEKKKEEGICPECGEDGFAGEAGVDAHAQQMH